MLCRFLSVNRYIMKIADINGVALIYFENRRYKWSCADIFEKSLIYFGGGIKMIVKERKMPVHLLQLEALLRRLPAHHPKRNVVAENLAKFMAGYKGEQAIEYPLSFLSEIKYSILHDIRLFDQKHYFQIDALIVSSCFLLFLEIKNIFGTLIFDTKFKSTYSNRRWYFRRRLSRSAFATETARDAAEKMAEFAWFI